MKTRSYFLVILFFLFVAQFCGPAFAQQNWRWQTKLIMAIRKNDLRAVKQAVTHGADVAGYGYDSKTEMPENWRPLQEAAEDGFLEIAHFLVSKGASIDSCDIFGSTPLMGACCKGRNEMVMWLLQQGASINAQGLTGTTPLSYACSFKHIETAKLLIKQKADVNLGNVRKTTPLFSAARNGDVD